MEISRAIEMAKEAADTAPEAYRGAAFSVILNHVLANEPPAQGGGSTIHSSNGSSQELPEWLSEQIAGLPEAHIVRQRGDRAQQAMWAVIRLCQDGAEATTDEVMGVIRTELGVTPQSSANTSRTLRGLTPRYVMRRERADTSYSYEPTARSLELFDDL